MDDTRRPIPDPAPEDLIPKAAVPVDGDDGPVATRLPAIADGVEREVDPAWVTVTRITSAIVAFVIAVPVAVGEIAVAVFADRLPIIPFVVLTVVALGIVGLLAWTAIVWPGLRHRHLRYRVDTDGLAIRRGVWWRTEARVPRSRVQHTDVTQGPIERSFGLATLIVFTAGTQHARVPLEGLRHETARAIRDVLVEGGEGDGV